MKGTFVKKSLLFVAAALTFLMPTLPTNAETNDDITVKIETDKESYKYDEEINYTITLTNESENVANDISINANLSTNAKIIEADGTINSNTVTLTIPTLDSQQSKVFTVKAIMQKPKEMATSTPTTTVTVQTPPSTPGKGTLVNTGGTSSLLIVLGSLVLIGLGCAIYFKKDSKRITSLLLLFTMSLTLMSLYPSPVNAEIFDITASARHITSVENETVTLDINVTATIVEPDLPTTITAYGLVTIADGDTDLTNNSPLEGVDIKLVDSNNDSHFYTCTSNANGEYTIFNISSGVYTLLASKEGYIPENTNISISEDSTGVFIPTLELIPVENNGIGTVSGTVFDAFTGNGVADITLYIRKGIDNHSNGEIIKTLTTSEDGSYSVELEAGNYCVEAVDNREVSANDTKYLTGYFNIKALADKSIDNQNGTITPVIENDQLRIVLTWGEYPRDLDSHLIGPTSDGFGNFHVFYNYGAYYEGSDLMANLDVDDVTSYGPETTTIYKPVNGIYSFYVHDYTNSNLTESNALGLSGAKVTVYKGNTILKTYNVPNVAGTEWHVFDYDSQTGALTDKNIMSYEQNPYNIGSLGSSANSPLSLEATIKPNSEKTVKDTTTENSSVTN